MSSAFDVRKQLGCLFFITDEKDVSKRMQSWRVTLLRIAEKDRSTFQIIRRNNANYQSLGFIQDLDQDLVR
jgi:hypothetical protein